MPKPTIADDQRRKQILDAAFDCFLQFGFDKTSMDDVAKKAGLSRPLIYLKFKNKEALFAGLYLGLMRHAQEESEKIAFEKLGLKEKLRRICEVSLLKPWEKLAGQPMADEFYNLCWEYCEVDAEKYWKAKVKLVAKLLGNAELAETFLMAVEGLHTDMPPTAVLRKRVHVLVDQFSR